MKKLILLLFLFTSFTKAQEINGIRKTHSTSTQEIKNPLVLNKIANWLKHKSNE